jgi:hypothetical protein
MTTTFTANTTGSGRVYVGGSVWATIHAETTGTTGANTYNCGVGLSGGTYQLNRSFLNFNTAALAGSKIISAFIRTYAEGGMLDTYTDTIDIVGSTQTDPTSIAAGDFDNLDTTVYSSIAVASLDVVAGHTNDFTLDAAGLLLLNKTGYTQFAMRTEKDRANSTPVGDGSSYYIFSGTTPILSVTYTPAPAISSNLPSLKGGEFIEF